MEPLRSAIGPWLGAWLGQVTIDWPLLSKALLQLGLLVVIVYFVYERFIRRSQAERLVKGLFVILLSFVALWGLARMLQFPMLELVFGLSIQLLMFGLMVIFQPELRRVLVYLGQPELFGKSFSPVHADTTTEALVSKLTEAVKFLSKSKTGALIVLESPNSSAGSYLEAGTAIDGELSTELLLTLFHPKTPLHDGAVVINAQHRVASAGVLLPLTEDPKLSWQYGTRHRAAIGLSEVSDSHCVVVSEETGSISLVHRGQLERMASADDLRRRLERVYRVQHRNEDGEEAATGHDLMTDEPLLPISDALTRRVQRWFQKRPPGEEDPPEAPAELAGTRGPF